MTVRRAALGAPTATAACHASCTWRKAQFFPPVVLLFKPQHFPDLPIGEGRLIADEVAAMGGLRTPLLQERPRRHFGRDGIVHGVENLKAQAVLLQTEMHDLSKISRVD